MVPEERTLHHRVRRVSNLRRELLNCAPQPISRSRQIQSARQTATAAFKSTPMEQRMLFAKPAFGELAPLTILPTAKYMRDAA